MSLGKITVITPPDILFNSTPGYLLIKPSIHIKQQFQSILSKSMMDLNVFIFDDDEHDISWMLNASNQSDVIIVDIDNCDEITKKFVTFIIARPNAYYITTDEITPYGLISKNRIYDLDFIVDQYNDDDDFDDEDSED